MGKVERDWIQVSHEMVTLIGAGAIPQRPWPVEPVALGFRFGGVGTPATVHWHAAPAATALPDEPLVLLIASAAVERLFGPLPADTTRSFHISAELRKIMMAVHDCTLPEPVREPYRLAKSIELLCDTLRLIGEGALVPVLGQCQLSRDDSRRVLAARAMIDERWREKLTLAGLSRACGLNRSKLTRGFREMFDCSIADTLAEKRLEGARAMLLSTDLPIASIGYRCGYLNNASFSRAFTRRFGTAPTQYRARKLAA